jgi:hypothetical protein
MNARPLVRALFLIVPIALAREAAAHQVVAQPALTRPLRVYFDCRGNGCDEEFFRQELHWVDHVRDQNDADLHVLVTAQLTGGGGYEYTIRVIGRERWEGREDLFLLTTEAGESQDTLRRSLLQRFTIVLARYALETPIGSKLKLEPPPKTDTAQTSAKQDPWNYWVYRINFNSFLNGQQGDRANNYNVNASANRTTDAWKINIGTGVFYSENRFELSDGTFHSYVRGRNIGALVVKSLTDHWSVGAMVRAARQTFTNHRLNFRVAPGIEYNIFPYMESTNRQLTFQWTTGYNRFKYDEETIYGLLEETRWDEQLLAVLSLRQPFGTVRLTSETAHYVDDAAKYRFAFSADNEIRLFRGFSFNVDGNYQIIHDQLYLPREGASDEEIIARQRQLATSYRYFVFLGITYRFGSINNNIVNQRFGGGF